jgi:large subunit ribosomal protein L21
MYAVIKAGGKQHKVKSGDVIQIEHVDGGAGDQITFEPILVVDDDGKSHFGKALTKALVTGTLMGERKGEKIRIFKYKSKTGYSKRQGHRQLYSLLEIGDVALGGAPPPKAAAPAKKPRAAAAKPEAAEPEETQSGAAADESTEEA